jgi:S-adenosylmethionine/arginine decarboxylase-like enzyme
MYGTELILDIHKCDATLFNREKIEDFCIKLCTLIDMQREDLHFWEDEDLPNPKTNPKTYGISAIQFILTSNITIHALPLLKSIYINIFSCKDFNILDAKRFAVKYWRGICMASNNIERI